MPEQAATRACAGQFRNPRAQAAHQILRRQSMVCLNATITASSAGESAVLLSCLGSMHASVVVVRERHLKTVARLIPCCRASIRVFSFNLWNSSRTRGVATGAAVKHDCGNPFSYSPDSITSRLFGATHLAATESQGEHQSSGRRRGRDQGQGITVSPAL